MRDPRGVAQLINTSRGGVLRLAGSVSVDVVAGFHARYGREPVPVTAIDAGSVTSMSAAGLDLVLDHLDAADLGGRSIRVRRSPVLERLLHPTH